MVRGWPDLDVYLNHLWKVFPGDVILHGGQTHDGELHVGGVAVHLVHGDLLVGLAADDVHRAAHRRLVLLEHVRVAELQHLRLRLEALEAVRQTLQDHILAPTHV